MQNDSFALGEQRRKQFAYAELARWNPALRARVPMDLLHSANAGRIVSLVGLKYQRMCMSPFVFLRGAAPLMAADLAMTGNTGISTQLCGDAHVQNLGAYEGLDGRLIFDINEFDETMRGPFEWDVKRMAASVLLAGHDADMKKGRCVQAVESFLASYCGLLDRLSLLPVLETARYQVHRLASVAPISKVLRKAERATQLRLRERLMIQTKAGFQFKQEPPLLQRIIGDEAEAVLAALPLYIESMLPERRHFFEQFRALDIGFKVLGTGSIGLRDYCVYMEGSSVHLLVLSYLILSHPIFSARAIKRLTMACAVAVQLSLSRSGGTRHRAAREQLICIVF